MGIPIAPERREAWESTGPLELRMTQRIGACTHADGTTFVFANPYELPAELCSAMAIIARGYTWRAALGFPSWEADDPTVYRLHCPSKTGTVWELRKLTGA